ncbi:GH23053 [Drosophila grimshawi]|uniref:GH23053 n=1 Tax=Drosophila grimshawi TaxID=7222 RepID=B4JWJ2_DROGR|nr:GH23053 [Drosophila grimshawi]
MINNLYELNRQLALLPTLVSTPSNCETAALGTRSGIHQILVPGYSRHWFDVSCDEDTQGGGWTTVLNRQDGTVDFYLFWNDYKNGFGNLNGEFFIGLEILHFMTKAGDQELLIIMENDKAEKRFAKYDRFIIGGEKEAYKLIKLGKYSGNAGDSLQSHVGQKFTTRDYDNDKYKGNCAQNYTGAWWYNNCLDRY